MPAQPYFFFRPLVAVADGSWAAIDWQRATPFTTKAADFVRCFAESDAGPLASTYPMLVAIAPAAVAEDALFAGRDARQLIFLLPGASLDDPDVVARCRQRRRQGHRFGVQIGGAEHLPRVPVSAFDYLYFDAPLARQEFSPGDLSFSAEAGFRRIAGNVGSHEMFGWIADKVFDWSDSHFLTSHNPLHAKEPDLTRLKLLRLLNLVRQDGDTHAIEGIFREEPKLSYNLLRLVNSVAVGARTRINNFSQAIAILGRRQLQRWLQLLIYANHLADGQAPNPLLQIAAARGRQMELLSAALPPQPRIAALSDKAFLTGLFSLLEVLINLPMKDVLADLPLPDEVVEALLSQGQGGVLGQLLAALLASEAGDFAGAEVLLRDLGISAATHAKSQLAALHWAGHINAGGDES